MDAVEKGFNKSFIWSMESLIVSQQSLQVYLHNLKSLYKYMHAFEIGPYSSDLTQYGCL